MGAVKVSMVTIISWQGVARLIQGGRLSRTFCKVMQHKSKTKRQAGLDDVPVAQIRRPAHTAHTLTLLQPFPVFVPFVQHLLFLCHQPVQALLNLKS